MGDGRCPPVETSIGDEPPLSPTSVAAAVVVGGSGGDSSRSGGGDTPFGDTPPAGATLVGLTAYTQGPRLVGIRGLYAAPSAAMVAAAAVAEVATAAAVAAAREGPSVDATAVWPTTRGALHGRGGRAHRLTLPASDLSVRVWRDEGGVCGVRVRGVGRGVPGGGGAGGSVGLRGGDGAELLPDGGGVARLWGRLDRDGRLADLRADASPVAAEWGGGRPIGDAGPFGIDGDRGGGAGGRQGDENGVAPPPFASGARLVLAATGNGGGDSGDGGGASGGPAPPCPFCGWVAGGPSSPPDVPPSAHEAAAVGARAVHVLRCMDARIAARAAAGVGALLPAATSAAAAAAAAAADGDHEDAGDAAAAAVRLAATPFPPGDVAELRAALADARAEIRRLRAALPPAAAAADDRRRCVVCRDADTAVVLLSCGHAVLCGACAAGVVGGGGGCPLCGGLIERVARVFFES